MQEVIKSDEEYARRQLEAFLRSSCSTEARCELVACDPPDLACHVGDETWGIEVTRVDQRIVECGFERSRSENDIPLREFGRELGNKTKDLRSGKHLLILHGPEIGTNWSEWKKHASKLITDFVSSRNGRELEFDGGSIIRCDDGLDWQVAIAPREKALTPSGQMTSNIAASIESMLAHALSNKAQKLAAVTGFKRIGLVLLNMYPFGDDASEIARVVHKIVQSEDTNSIYDFVFYECNDGLHLVYRR